MHKFGDSEVILGDFVFEVTALVVLIYWLFLLTSDYVEFGTKTDFTVEVQHGGVMKMVDSKLQYLGGEVEYFDWCDVDLMSTLELNDFGERLGYNIKHIYFYKCGKSGEIKNLITDKDVLDWVDGVGDDRIGVVYFSQNEKPLKVEQFVQPISDDSDSGAEPEDPNKEPPYEPETDPEKEAQDQHEPEPEKKPTRNQQPEPEKEPSAEPEPQQKKEPTPDQQPEPDDRLFACMIFE